MPTRINLEIYAHTKEFKRLFKCAEFTDVYLNFKHIDQYWYSQVTIYKTSAKCYRAMYYSSYCACKKQCAYKSYRSLADLCVDLETFAERQCK